MKGILKMKKILTVLFALCISASITACGTSSSAPQKETNSNSVSEGNPPNTEGETFTLNDTAVFKNLKVTATKIEESGGNAYITPESGNVYVGISFEIENISNESQAISSMLLFDAYADDVKCNYSISANTAFNEGMLDGEISAGKKLVGCYATEVPNDWQKLELEVKSDWLSGNKAKFVFTK